MKFLLALLALAVLLVCFSFCVGELFAIGTVYSAFPVIAVDLLFGIPVLLSIMGASVHLYRVRPR